MNCFMSRQLYLYLLIYFVYSCNGWVGKYCNSDWDCLNKDGRFFGEVCRNQRCACYNHCYREHKIHHFCYAAGCGVDFESKCYEKHQYCHIPLDKHQPCECRCEEGYHLASDNETCISGNGIDNYSGNCNDDHDCGPHEHCAEGYWVCVCRNGFKKVHGRCIRGNCLIDSDCVRYNWKRKCENQYCACANGYHKLHQKCIKGNCVSDRDCQGTNVTGECYNEYCTCAYGFHRIRKHCISGECLDDSDCNATGITGECQSQRCVYSRNDNSLHLIALIVVVTSSIGLVISLGVGCFVKHSKNRQRRQPTASTTASRDENGMTGVFNMGYREEATAPPMSSQAITATVIGEFEELLDTLQTTNYTVSTENYLSTVGDAPPPYRSLFPMVPTSISSANRRDTVPSYATTASGY